MDELPRKKLLAGFLPRSGSERSRAPSYLSGTGTALSSLNLDDDDDDLKGPLGLVTLYDPPSPLIATAELVFIHGLGGGSRKSWSYSSDPHHFWPQAWLPVDPAFRDVRVHSFGYAADWGERRQSTLNIHDFGQMLLGSLRNHPTIRREATRIILVGHSMGGCVAKKAYVMAREDPTCKDFAARVRAMFFLATPHRGSDMAATLENILTATWGRKPFVSDLVPNSTTLSMLNDSFRHFAPDLHLWSFYEARPHRSAVAARIVVDRHSATLGYPNEEVTAMNADHRRVCKFESPNDPNYQMLRNALHTALDMIRDTQSDTAPPYESHGSEDLDRAPTDVALRLKSFLDVQSGLESDLAILQGLREPGSCQWLTEKASYSRWQSGKGPGILWLCGRPATGKSVLSSHVIDQLKPARAFCSYFFYKHGVAGKSTWTDCFRCLAFQMAMQDNMVKEKLVQLQADGFSLEGSDDSTVWRKLFVGCIFKLPTICRHFWVIDGVDECTNFNGLFTKRFLAAVPDELRLFVTSRDLDAIERGLSSLGARATMETISDSDTQGDMRLFLRTKLRELSRLGTDEECESMCNKILQKSRGSFLWTRLVLEEFENAWTEEAMEQVLNEVPAGLQDLYSRMVQSIEMDSRKMPLARSILSWVVLASRALSLDELRCAVWLDMHQRLHNLDKAIPALCGQLVFVDQDGLVHMIHETAREFLLGQCQVSGLGISRREGHTRLGRLLLGYLTSDVLTPRPTGQRTAKSRWPAKTGPATGATTQATADPSDAALLGYASRFFSDHVSRGASADDNLMEALCGFLASRNVLFWIEHVAQSKDLDDVTQTAVNLRRYLGKRAKSVLPPDPSMHLVEEWVTDLIRVTVKFQGQLLSCPSSIHTLIPPLCPLESVIHRTFARVDVWTSGLVVKGLGTAYWDDCLTRMDFQNGQVATVAHGERFLAVGLSAGQISLYDAETLQWLRNLHHPGRVRILQFSNDDRHLVSCTAKHIVVWEPKSGTKVHCFDVRSPPLSVAFPELDEMFCVFQSSELSRWDLDTGECDSISWKEAAYVDRAMYLPSAEVVIPDQPPVNAAFHTIADDVLLAVGYRAHLIVVFSVRNLQVLGQCGAEANNGIDAMVFNPNPEIASLVVSYKDGRLCLFDYRTMVETFAVPRIYAQSVACSPDGRSLVAGSSGGAIDVFEFDQDDDGGAVLVPIYRVGAGLGYAVRSVTFSRDGLRFVDVRAKQCRVWEPAALVRKNELESRSDSVGIPLPAADATLPSDAREPEISSSLVASADGRYVIAGRRGGSVSAFSTRTAAEVGVLYRHDNGVNVTAVALAEPSNLVVSADDSGRVLVAKLELSLPSASADPKPAHDNSIAAHVILDRRFGSVVVQVLVNPSGDRLLVSGRHVDELWELPSGKIVAREGSAETSAGTPGHRTSGQPSAAETGDHSQVDVSPDGTIPVRSPFQHPSNPDWLVIVANSTARVYSWVDFAELTNPTGGIKFERPENTDSPRSPSPITTTHVRLHPSVGAEAFLCSQRVAHSHWGPPLHAGDYGSAASRSKK
ncbi:hypothetical protein VTK73DRAFT_5572 [Phialemonium thermophilum]|uniref:GPI inositol-deacylase n=1 Tax=Phialemonium thermophilum TaxID=223376 RepID=A0ABR3XXU6_9PEZI